MKFKDIHIGDVLKIREWDDMASEFGINQNGNIPCNLVFVHSMKYLCGNRFTVKYVYNEAANIRPEEEEFTGWHISADMLEPFWETDELDDINDSELIDILGG